MADLATQIRDYLDGTAPEVLLSEVRSLRTVRPVPGEAPPSRRRWPIAAAAGLAAVVAVLLAVLFWPRSGDPALFIEEGSTIPQPATTVPVIPVIMVDDARATAAPVTSPDEPGLNTPDYVGSLGGDSPVLAVSAEEVWTATEWIDPDGEQSQGSVVWRRKSGIDGAWEWHTLPGAEVLQLAMTPDGTVWAATQIGVFSLDGGEWTQRFDGLVADVAVAADGTVWIGGRTTWPSAWDLWLARWDGETFVRVDPAPKPLHPFDSGVALAAESSGAVWVTRVALSFDPDSGSISLARFDGETLETVQVEVVSPPAGVWYGQMVAIEVAPNGALWVTGLGDSPYPFIARFDGASWTVWDWPFPEYPQIGGYLPLYCDMAVGPDGVVWFSWGGGLGSFDGQEWVVLIEGDGPGWHPLVGVDVAPDGTVWYLLGDGLHRLTP